MKAAAIFVLRLYKRWISPSLAPSCRYVPSCSEYAMEAIERYGWLRGGGMAAWRLLRCHPFVKGGYDPVTKNSHESDALWGRGCAPSERGIAPLPHKGSHRPSGLATVDRRLTTSNRVG
jgi:uncharacterized protein